VRILVVAVAAVAASTATAAVNVGKPPIHPEVQVGGFPTGIALNPVTGTIYVGNGTTGTLSVIDGKRCNAAESRGCSQRVAVATAGVDPIGIAVDRSTNTIYAANASGTVAIVDGRRCSAENRAGCRTAPATVRVGINPQFLAVDETTHTLYVANSGSDTISVIDGRSGRVKGSVSVGPIPFTLAVQPGDAHGLRDRSRRADRLRCRRRRVQRGARPRVQAPAGDGRRRRNARRDRARPEDGHDLRHG
jgi:YVTN family beta-propeller protein